MVTLNKIIFLLLIVAVVDGGTFSRRLNSKSSRIGDLLGFNHEIACDPNDIEPLKKMACQLSRQSVIDIGSWVYFEGALLLSECASLHYNAEWEKFKAVLILVNEIVDNIAQVDEFLNRIGIREYFNVNGKYIKMRFLADYPKDRDFRPVHGPDLFEQLYSSPMWQLDHVAPHLLKDLHVKHLVIQHRFLRRFANRDPYVFEITNFGDSVVDHVLGMRISKFRRCAIRGEFIVTWTRRFVEWSTGRNLTTRQARALGRVYGLMFLKGIKTRVFDKLPRTRPIDVLSKEFWDVVGLYMIDLSKKELHSLLKS